ncbi:MAG: MmgE/PrpD family protein [Chloroflexota bacterium]
MCVGYREGVTRLSMAPNVTAAEELVEFCLVLRWGELPTEVQARTRELVLDLLGVALAGSQQPSSPPARQSALTLGGSTGNASIVGTQGDRTSAVWAAMANGTAAHAVELDDVTTESSLHPGVAVIPPAFALAEERGATPQDFFAAVVAGYEVTMRVGNALNPASAYARGFHPTGVAGVFGATVAAGYLLGLSSTQLVHALGVAGTMASGSLEYLAQGAWTKRLNPGWAGHAGITAATLAQAGFTGPTTVFEGRLGVLHAYTDAPATDRLLAQLGEPLQVMRVSIKPYACCRYNHGLIDAALRLRAQHQLQPEDISEMRLGVLTGGAVLVADPIEQKRRPASVVDAQFSAPFAAAAAIAFGTGGVDAYTSERLADAGVRDLMARTTCYADPALDAVYPLQWPAAMQVRTYDGRDLSTYVPYATGEPENPVSRDGLVAKFVSLVSGMVPDPENLAQKILGLESTEDLTAVASALRGQTRPAG